MLLLLLSALTSAPLQLLCAMWPYKPVVPLCATGSCLELSCCAAVHLCSGVHNDKLPCMSVLCSVAFAGTIYPSDDCKVST